MGIPWLWALRAIPWGTILTTAVAMRRSADSLATTPPPRADGPSRNDLRALADRIAALEQRDRETALLLTRVTAQLEALTTAGEVLEARVRWLLAGTIAAVILSIVASGIALFPR